jgi:2-polyprenyl-6-methoxyphenol hydroxylase-like FAD-dependent oxidoreductase
MLLARRGYDVLLVDRSHFPSDTVSTHLIHPPGVAALDRWGLLGRLVGTGCPPISTYSFDFGPVLLTGTPQTAAATEVAYCPRRTILDAHLVEAADEGGAEVRDGFTVSEFLFDGDAVVGIRGHASGGSPVTERARVVIGADGAHSRVADLVGADSYRERPMLSVGYYAYWSGFPVAGAEWIVRAKQGFGIAPTNDGLTLLLAGWPYSERHSVKTDVDGHYLRALRQVLGDRLDSARRETRVVGGGAVNRFRTPYGPGWALVGDAGYVKDPVTAQGISDAFHDAELCADAVDAALSGERTFADAMAEYQRSRDARVLPMYEFTAQIGSLTPPPLEFQELLAAIAGNQQAMTDFASMFAGALSPATFFDPANIGRLVSSPTVSAYGNGMQTALTT